jgi:predicted helicase
VPAAFVQGERAAVYLTNALTGWNPADETGSLETAFEVLARERAAATDVKQNQPILVVLGNPPYNAFAGTSPASEGGLVEPYKQGLQDRWRVRKFNLDDLYIRFFRVAERRVAERTGQGIVCFISNYSWLSYGSFVVMRERLLSEFDTIWIDNLNGDSRETGKLTPDGDPDPSVFSTAMNREGIPGWHLYCHARATGALNRGDRQVSNFLGDKQTAGFACEPRRRSLCPR